MEKMKQNSGNYKVMIKLFNVGLTQLMNLMFYYKIVSFQMILTTMKILCINAFRNFIQIIIK